MANFGQFCHLKITGFMAEETVTTSYSNESQPMDHFVFVPLIASPITDASLKIAKNSLASRDPDTAIPPDQLVIIHDWIRTYLLVSLEAGSFIGGGVPPLSPNTNQLGQLLQQFVAQLAIPPRSMINLFVQIMAYTETVHTAVPGAASTRKETLEKFWVIVLDYFKLNHPKFLMSVMTWYKIYSRSQDAALAFVIQARLVNYQEGSPEEMSTCERLVTSELIMKSVMSATHEATGHKLTSLTLTELALLINSRGVPTCDLWVLAQSMYLTLRELIEKYPGATAADVNSAVFWTDNPRIERFRQLLKNAIPDFSVPEDKKALTALFEHRPAVDLAHKIPLLKGADRTRPGDMN